MSDLGTKHIEIDFLYVDIENCKRCQGTDLNLASAIEMAQALLDAADATVTVRRTLVDSAQKAQELGLISSPTIRVNGRDVDVDLHESRCEDCTSLCGCSEDILCRVWRYRGQDYEVAPVSILLNAIMSAVYAPAPAADRDASRPRSTSENLSRFFGAKEEKRAGCCGPDRAATCCPPEEKASCCGAAASALQPATCGC